MYAMQGIRVADFTTMIAGTFATTLLADLGADVIKIEPMEGEPWRRVGGLFLGTNRGKRGIALDIKHPEGYEVLRLLITSSDIFVENTRPGATKKVGLDYDTLVKIKPDLIYVSILAHGSTGPYSTSPGYDPLLQARSGMMAAQGGVDQPPVYLKIAINDLAAPMLAAYAIALALYHRQRTGQGQYIETSLTNAAAVMQSNEFLSYAGLERRSLGGSDVLGTSATDRLYETADRWIYVLCANDEQWRSLCHVLDNETLLQDPRFASAEARQQHDETLAAILATAFKADSAESWCRRLKAAGVPAAVQLELEEIMHDPHFLQNEVLVDHDYWDYGRVRQPGLVPRFADTPGKVQRPAPGLGQHNGPVLLELGYSLDDIRSLYERKIIT
jgi:crotonobetainyl-CoA:carnitine CoA-transferase CaiB-like acyl-CoA transferase